MKKILLSLVVGVLVFGGVQGVVRAQVQDGDVLPRAGITPGSPFYFLDRLGETFREFFTFNPESKARLQIIFAGERIAEIKIVLETKGVEAKGLDVAQSRLQINFAKAATIVESEKQKGKDVSELAKSLNEGFEEKKEALKGAFEDEKDTLKKQEKELKNEIRDARQTGDTAQVEILTEQLSEVKAQKELLKVKKDEQEEELEDEKERLEEGLEVEEKARQAIREAEKEKQNILDEALKEGITLPADTFAEFDNLFSQAQSAFQAGDYQEARRFAKQAEELVEEVEDIIEEAEEEEDEENEEDEEDENDEDDEDDEGSDNED